MTSVPTRTAHVATGVDAVTDLVARTCTTVCELTPLGEGPASMSVVTARSAEVDVDRCHLGFVGEAVTEPLEGRLAVTSVRSGAFAVDGGAMGFAALTRGEPCLYPVDASYLSRWHDCRADVVQLPLERVRSIAEELTGRPARRLRFTSTEPASRPLARLWTATSEMLWAQMSRAGGPADQPLVRDAMQRVAVTAVLSTFPNTAADPHGRPGPGHVGASAYRRAVAWIEDHAGEPIGVGEIAAAAGTSGPDLVNVFGLRRGHGPMTYLGQVRLERAHRDILAAGPPADPRARVEAIRARWGFADPVAFAVAYHDRYGTSPETDVLAD